MKKLLIFVCFAFLLVACSSESTIKETATEYLKKQLKNPESFKVEQIVVKKDTIPFYLNKEVINLAKKANEAMDEFQRYKDMSYLFAEEKLKSSTQMIDAMEKLKVAVADAKHDTPSIEYLVFVNYSGTNSLGGTVSNRAIVIVDGNDPNKILGTFDVDNDFIGEFMAIKYAIDPDFEFKENKFGKIETEGLPYFEQFLLNDNE